jgi:deoxyribose-phosphate aldolase
MAMVLLRVLDDRFQADVLTRAMETAGVPHLLRDHHDTAYDGLFISQRGYASLYVAEESLSQAQELDRELHGQDLPLPTSAVALARLIDHTLLDPGAGEEDLERFLGECLEMRPAAACLSPWMVLRAAKALEGSGVAVCSVVGFPLGTALTASKVSEAVQLSQAGATELDVVINRGLVASERLGEAAREMDQVASAAKGCLVKVIVEMPQLGFELGERLAGHLAVTGVHMLKTGTGFFGPAEAAQVQVLQAAGNLPVKAAGGIGDLNAALAMAAAGAARLGSSRGYQIWLQARARWGA